MAEYTYKDVIIDPDDPRVEIGKEYYFGDTPAQVLDSASAECGLYRLMDINPRAGYPFEFDTDLSCSSYPCIIRKKEPEKKYVPFDLSNEEDRVKLRGAWVKAKADPDKQQNVCGMCSRYVYLTCQAEGYDAEEFLEKFTFLDGSPCGKLVEEEI